MQRKVVMRRVIAAIAVFACSLVVSAPQALAQVAEAQRLLNALSLDVGAADGAAGPRTMEAWRKFLEHRGLPLDTALDTKGLAELRPVTKVPFPQARAIDFDFAGRGFPSKHSYVRDPDDPSQFCIAVKKGDYDTVDYRKSSHSTERQYAFPLRKQRAELVSQVLRAGRPYTVDFEVKVDVPSAGIIFQVHRGEAGGGGMNLSTINDTLRLTMGGMLENVVVLRGDWYGKWQQIRVTIFPDPKGKSWVKIYANGAQVVDSTGQDPFYPMTEAQVHWGLYRGSIQSPATACYRGLAISNGDLGAP